MGHKYFWKNTSKRAYNLQNIEKAFNAGKRVQGKTSSPSASASNATSTVADLFAAVKRMDTYFIPNSANKVVNADGTPNAVYHGTNNAFFKDIDGMYYIVPISAGINEKEGTAPMRALPP